MSDTKKIIEAYAQELRAHDIPLTALYLFGSRAKGSAREDSDIDVAVVSSWCNRADATKRLMLRRMRRKVDVNIEPHGFSLEDFANESDPLVHEIKSSGIKVF